MAPRTAESMLQNFRMIYPEIMPSLTSLRFLEQYDPMDESVESKSQPFAYVCDVVHEVKLGIEVDEVRGKGVNNDAWTAMMDLRDKLAPGEKVSWFVVVCGDIERWAPPEATLSVNAFSNGNGPHVNGRAPSQVGSGASRSSWGREESEVGVVVAIVVRTKAKTQSLDESTKHIPQPQKDVWRKGAEEIQEVPIFHLRNFML